MFSLRIVNADHYLGPPKCGLDLTYSQFRGAQIKSVPVIRIYGSTPTGEKTCLHVHGVFPYILVPYNGAEDAGRVMYQLAASLDKAINISLGSSHSNKQHVFKIVQVSGRPFYGYHGQDHQFLKIYFYNPLIIKRASDLLQNGAICGTQFQIHESHVPFILQFFIDYNLYGMSFINLKNVIYRKEGNPPGVAPGTLAKESFCELEADAVAVDILNRLIVEGELAVNPGLVAIWNEEKKRLQKEVLESSQRPTPQKTRSEIFLRGKLKDNLKAEGTLEASLKENIPYPAETQRTSSLQDASILETHSVSSLTLHTETLVQGEYADVNEELVLNLTQSSMSMSLDQSLLCALDSLAAAHDTQSVPSSQNVDDDSILGSQMLPQPATDAEDYALPPELSSDDNTILDDDQDLDDLEDNIPQLDGIGDLNVRKNGSAKWEKKDERKILVENSLFENQLDFDGNATGLGFEDDWPDTEKMDEIFQEDETFNSPIHESFNYDPAEFFNIDFVNIDPSFNAVLRGDPSFTCRELGSTSEDVFLGDSRNNSVWNLGPDAPTNDETVRKQSITPLKTLENVTTTNCKKRRKKKSVRKRCTLRKIPSQNNNNVDIIDVEKQITNLPSCTEDLLNTSQLDEMFNEDLNKGLEVIIENNSQHENIESNNSSSKMVSIDSGCTPELLHGGSLNTELLNGDEINITEEGDEINITEEGEIMQEDKICNIDLCEDSADYELAESIDSFIKDHSDGQNWLTNFADNNFNDQNYSDAYHSSIENVSEDIVTEASPIIKHCSVVVQQNNACTGILENAQINNESLHVNCKGTTVNERKTRLDKSKISSDNNGKINTSLEEIATFQGNENLNRVKQSSPENGIKEKKQKGTNNIMSNTISHTSCNEDMDIRSVKLGLTDQKSCDISCTLPKHQKEECRNNSKAKGKSSKMISKKKECKELIISKSIKESNKNNNLKVEGQNSSMNRPGEIQKPKTKELVSNDTNRNSVKKNSPLKRFENKSDGNLSSEVLKEKLVHSKCKKKKEIKNNSTCSSPIKKTIINVRIKGSNSPHKKKNNPILEPKTKKSVSNNLQSKNINGLKRNSPSKKLRNISENIKDSQLFSEVCHERVDYSQPGEMSIVEISQYFSQIQYIASHYTDNGKCGTDLDKDLWSPLRKTNPLKKNSAKRNQKSRKIVSIAKQIFRKKQFSALERKKLTNCYVLLKKLTKEEIEMLCRGYHVQQRSNKGKLIKSRSHKNLKPQNMDNSSTAFNVNMVTKSEVPGKSGSNKRKDWHEGNIRVTSTQLHVKKYAVQFQNKSNRSVHSNIDTNTNNKPQEIYDKDTDANSGDITRKSHIDKKGLVMTKQENQTMSTKKIRKLRSNKTNCNKIHPDMNVSVVENINSCNDTNCTYRLTNTRSIEQNPIMRENLHPLDRWKLVEPFDTNNFFLYTFKNVDLEDIPLSRLKYFQECFTLNITASCTTEKRIRQPLTQLEIKDSPCVSTSNSKKIGRMKELQASSANENLKAICNPTAKIFRDDEKMSICDKKGTHPENERVTMLSRASRRSSLPSNLDETKKSSTRNADRSTHLIKAMNSPEILNDSSPLKHCKLSIPQQMSLRRSSLPSNLDETKKSRTGSAKVSTTHLHKHEDSHAVLNSTSSLKQCKLDVPHQRSLRSSSLFPVSDIEKKPTTRNIKKLTPNFPAVGSSEELNVSSHSKRSKLDVKRLTSLSRSSLPSNSDVARMSPAENMKQLTNFDGVCPLKRMKLDLPQQENISDQDRVDKRKCKPKVERDSEAFNFALKAIRSGAMGFLKASKVYGVCNRTLWLEYKKRGYPPRQPGYPSHPTRARMMIVPDNLDCVVAENIYHTSAPCNGIFKNDRTSNHGESWNELSKSRYSNIGKGQNVEQPDMKFCKDLVNNESLLDNRLSSGFDSHRKKSLRMYSLDGNVDNSSDENTGKDELKGNIPSCSTPTKKKTVLKKRASPKSGSYVPLDIEIKKSPKTRRNESTSLGNISRTTSCVDIGKPSTSHKNLTKDGSQHSAECRQENENINKNFMLDAKIRIERIPPRTINMGQKKEMSDCSASGEKLPIDQPNVKRLKVTIKRLSCDNKETVAENEVADLPRRTNPRHRHSLPPSLV